MGSIERFIRYPFLAFVLLIKTREGKKRMNVPIKPIASLAHRTRARVQLSIFRFRCSLSKRQVCADKLLNTGIIGQTVIAAT
jgi:hypothetical protein